MKTLLITRFPYSSQLGGEELHTVRLAEELIKRGWRILLWTSCPVLVKEFENLKLSKSKLEIYNLKFFPKPPVSKLSLFTFTMVSPFIFFYFLIKFREIKKREKITAVYMLSLSEKILLTSSIVIPNLIRNYFHPKDIFHRGRKNDTNIVWIEHARIGSWLTKNPWRIFYQFWTRWVKIIAVSKQSAKMLSWAKNVIDIPNGIDLNEIRIKKKIVETKLEKFMRKGYLPKERSEQNCFKIGYIGRLTEDKGIKELIAATKKLENVELKIVGEGPLLNYFEHNDCHPELVSGSHAILTKDSSPAERDQNDNFITFLGKLSRQEIIKFYQTLDLFVLPSTKHDPFGLVIAEAMAAAVPTVVTDVCGISDYLEDGYNCRIIPAGNIEVIAEAIEWYQEDPDKRNLITQNAQKTVKEKFALEKMVDSYEKLFETKN